MKEWCNSHTVTHDWYNLKVRFDLYVPVWTVFIIHDIHDSVFDYIFVNGQAINKYEQQYKLGPLIQEHEWTWRKWLGSYIIVVLSSWPITKFELQNPAAAADSPNCSTEMSSARRSCGITHSFNVNTRRPEWGAVTICKQLLSMWPRSLDIRTRLALCTEQGSFWWLF